MEREGDLRFIDGSNTRRAGNAVALLVMTSYLIQFFNRVLRSYSPYRVFVILAFVILLSANRKLSISSKATVVKLWICFPLVVAINMMLHTTNIGFMMDVMTYWVGIFFVAYMGTDSHVYCKALKVILFFSLLFAFSIFVQLFVPSIYNIYLNLLPGETRELIRDLRSTYGMYTGFSTNSGFTAGHIVSGLIAAFSLRITNSVRRERFFRAAVFILIAALLLTGKRGHLLACVSACLICYLICTSGKKRFLAVNVILVGLAIFIPLFMFFSDVVSVIPVLGRLSETLNGIAAGADVSNGRSKLYFYAIQLFKSHPLFGIGWGQFRYSVVGNVTFMTELDTHNIYLQLLSETGILGFLAFVFPAFYSLLKSIKNLKSVFMRNNDNPFIKTISVYALGYQIFFLLYGISGNPLFDYNYVIMYFVAVSMMEVTFKKMRMIDYY